MDASTFRSLIRNLLCLTTTRPDIIYPTSLLSRFMQSPSQIHYRVAKTKLRYLRGIKEYGIWYKPTTEARLFVCIDNMVGLDRLII